MIARHEVIQGALSLYEAPRYLEIGVARGITFHKLEAAHKVAVDPAFRFDVEAARRDNPKARYVSATSDEYFGTMAEPGTVFDVIYLDGLHTAEQTLRDFVNAIEYLSPRGVIILDDVKPPNPVAALPDRAKYVAARTFVKSRDKAWMGDIYKVVYFISTFVQQFSYRTVAENHGQAMVWRERRARVPARTIEAIGRKSFEDFVMERRMLAVTPYAKILAAIRAAHGSAAQGSREPEPVA